jgi:hypothetical protein
MMKRFTVAATLGLLILGCGAISFAEESQSSNPWATGKAYQEAQKKKVKPDTYNPHTNFERFSKDLTLNKDQQEKCRTILEDLEKQLIPLKGTTYERRAVRGAPAVTSHYDQIRAVLEPEQVTKFDQMITKGQITSISR